VGGCCSYLSLSGSGFSRQRRYSSVLARSRADRKQAEIERIKVVQQHLEDYESESARNIHNHLSEYHMLSELGRLKLDDLNEDQIRILLQFHRRLHERGERL